MKRVFDSNTPGRLLSYLSLNGSVLRAAKAHFPHFPTRLKSRCWSGNSGCQDHISKPEASEKTLHLDRGLEELCHMSVTRLSAGQVQAAVKISLTSQPVGTTRTKKGRSSSCTNHYSLKILRSRRWLSGERSLLPRLRT